MTAIGTSYSAKRRHRRQLVGLCVECGAPPVINKTKCQKCADKVAEYCATHYTGEAEALAKRKAYKKKNKLAAFDAYGGAICACPKCPETNIEFLTIDHMDGSGGKHRRENGFKTSQQIHLWLKRNNYPSGFQVLCWNCNTGRHFNGGVCPHMKDT